MPEIPDLLEKLHQSWKVALRAGDRQTPLVFEHRVFQISYLSRFACQAQTQDEFDLWSIGCSNPHACYPLQNKKTQKRKIEEEFFLS